SLIPLPPRPTLFPTRRSSDLNADLRSVSSTTSTLNSSPVRSTTVRQTPFTAIESPCLASATTLGPEMVSRHPPSCCWTPVTAPSSSTIPVNTRFLPSAPGPPHGDRTHPHVRSAHRHFFHFEPQSLGDRSHPGVAQRGPPGSEQ